MKLTMDQLPDAWRPFAKPRGTRDPVRNLDARAKAFLARIAPLSADLQAHGRTRALALQKLRRICQAEVRRLKASYSLATVKLYLSKYRDAIRASDPNHLVLRPRKMRSGQRFSYFALDPEETGPSTPPITSASTGTSPTSSPLSRRPSSRKLWLFWAATATWKKAWASWR